jgi:transcription-repair coupling factor (superfamily II helicase)
VPYISLSEIEDALSVRDLVELGPASPEQESELARSFIPGPRFGGRLRPLLDHLKERFSAGEPVFVVSRQSARLTELWAETRHTYADDSDRSRTSDPVFIEASLSEGWTFNPGDGAPLHLLTDGEIFGWRRPEPRFRRGERYPFAESPEAPYADLQVGDWVVHVDHGIGRYLGLVSRIVDGMEREYLSVEYADNDQLFVPVYQADRLTRYIGPDSHPPVLSRLGGIEWQSAKRQAREAAQEIAQDLLDLYAQRLVVQGYAFPSDTAWQQELEASFPYVETLDQLRVITEVKQDMESQRPMDRLICGDVGYGKTEVALRAAFKAVNSGKQAAVLVPTTVLAQQHYNTFRERLAAFPVEVEMLSRFRSPQQQRDILFRLVKGSVDIIIGTHRLLQGDVEFKDLGLLIIDEEQRFGVTHKETLKKMRTEMDVLTLTATPIPRTLYMALTGVRDISMINTPPEERLPIVTHVGPYSQKLVRQSILRELERGGQVFFVHNRVQTIEAMRQHLEKLVPEARITVAHGQMNENDLSARMEKFTAGEVDILLTTSIIESGLDIPNANTLIVDRADTFGLAQLYQLRGRVGRGAQRAYAYFFRHARRPPSIEGRQRLETIAENTQLGAGYSIAMRDLEIRGAGEILGTRQHGHIAAVGFHLYTRLLADSVERLRKKQQAPLLPLPTTLPPEIRMSINVDLPLPIGIPADYVADKDMRLRLYRRIANLNTMDEIEALIGEFIDRFGPIPEPVNNLFYQLKVKILAEAISLVSISTDGGKKDNGQIVLRFSALPEGVPTRTFPPLGSDVRSSKNALWLQVQPKWTVRLLEVLEQLVAWGGKETRSD